jgi:3-deoxy-D-manno-octulosonic acid kinase
LKSEDSVIVYDDSLVSQFTEQFFEPAYWAGAHTSSGKAGGRGAVIFIVHEGQDWVLRHYYRGGLPGKLLHDQFLWTGAAATRSLREWELLQEMRSEGLPAPIPVAARCRRHGIIYNADLITVRLPGVLPLSTRLAQGDVDEAEWRAVGACIARFHSAGFCHADLNAHNLQLDGSSSAYLLDWDRGERREPGGWRESNLRRLKRSLRKISDTGTVRYDPDGWGFLIEAYKQNLSG